ncbi:hypothetical protein [Thalassotalea crassostreae]|nr:hypothetical protein [Thalassotalea crassostreae]
MARKPHKKPIHSKKSSKKGDNVVFWSAGIFIAIILVFVIAS